MDFAKDNAFDTKKFLAGKEYLVSGLSRKAVSNNDATKWDNFDKIKPLSEKINDSKKKHLFDLTMTVSLEMNQKCLRKKN